MKEIPMRRKIALLLAGVCFGFAIQITIPRGGDHVGELRDYEVVMEVKVLILNVEGGEIEAVDLSKALVQDIIPNSTIKIKVEKVNDMGPSEKNAERPAEEVKENGE